MRGSLSRTLAIAAIVAITIVVVFEIFTSGPDPRTGRCVDAQRALVGCRERAALYELVREVDSGVDCPADALKLYQFRSSLYCGRALHGAPAPSPAYVSCLLLAGAKLAAGAADLRFASGFAAAPGTVGGNDGGTVKVRGDDWRIFYVLAKGQLDPGVRAIVASPARAVFVAYITGASTHRKAVAAATRC